MHYVKPYDKPFPRFKAKQIEMMNLQSNVQAVLIGLLSKYCTINVGRPHRKSVLTQQFIKIKTLEFGKDDLIDVPTYIQKRSVDKAKFEFGKGNTTQKTAKRRIQPTRRLELMRLLQDILFLYDFHVFADEEDIDGYGGDVFIYYKNQLLFNTTEIIKKGTMINDIITKELETSKNALLQHTSFNTIV
ncbi:TATA-binding protein-associated phosphoprotein [Entamoeba marina]